MTDEMENWENLLKASPPPPSDAAKKAALDKGLHAFDEKILPARQGSGFAGRLMDAVRNIHQLLPGDPLMKNRQLIAGGAVLTFAVILATTTQLVPPPQGEPKPQKADYSASGQATFSAPSPGEAVHAQIDVASPAEKEMARQEDSVVSREPSANMPVPEYKKAAPALQDRAIMAERIVAPLPPSAPMPGSAPMAPAQVSNFAAIGSISGGAPGYAGPAETTNYEIAPHHYKDEGRDRFDHVKSNAIKRVQEEPVSTFSVDVDTASYAFLRASLNNNVLPQKDAVRIEELVNYFPYEYEGPKSKDEPFKANASVMPSPWNAKNKLIHIGIKGYQVDAKEKPRANLVFLIDTSGSMNSPERLPLLVNSLKLLLDTLKADDVISIVTYAGSAGTALPPTKVSEKSKILAALDNLSAGGSTAGAEGIRQAYALAEQNFDKSGINRVLLATDGDFNVGISNHEELKSFVERKRETGIYLSVLGFGRGNYNDQMMQALAQNGNGNAAYIDSLNEARKTLVEEAGSTLFPIAGDVKIQVEFNPAMVAEYRLIGYETRILNREDFNNDKVDAGDIGAGHTVTALYEITPAGTPGSIDPLRYGNADKAEKPAPAPAKDGAAQKDEYAFVKIRYKLPGESTSKLIESPVGGKLESKALGDAPQEARFAASVAAFGQLLKGDGAIGSFSYDDAITLAESAKGADRFGYRAEFINLLRVAKRAAAMSPPVSGGQGYETMPVPTIR